MSNRKKNPQLGFLKNKELMIFRLLKIQAVLRITISNKVLIN